MGRNNRYQLCFSNLHIYLCLEFEHYNSLAFAICVFRNPVAQECKGPHSFGQSNQPYQPQFFRKEKNRLMQDFGFALLPRFFSKRSKVFSQDLFEQLNIICFFFFFRLIWLMRKEWTLNASKKVQIQTSASDYIKREI